MTLRDVMTKTVIRIQPEEPVAVAARTLAHYNVGSLPVCGSDGRVCGMVTDRDIVVRCLAAGRSPVTTSVRDVMTSHVVSARPDTEVGAAAQIMGQEQIRRMPVMENGKLCGMISIADLIRTEEGAEGALAEISGNLSSR